MSEKALLDLAKLAEWVALTVGLKPSEIQDEVRKAIPAPKALQALRAAKGKKKPAKKKAAKKAAAKKKVAAKKKSTKRRHVKKGAAKRPSTRKKQTRRKKATAQA